MTLPQLDSKGHSKVNQIYQLIVSNGDLYLNCEYSDSIGFYFVTDRGLVWGILSFGRYRCMLKWQ